MSIILQPCEVCGAWAALMYCASCGAEQAPRCTKIAMLTGTGCDLAAGHAGDHVRTYTNIVKPYSVTWNEERDQGAVDREADKPLGT